MPGGKHFFENQITKFGQAVAILSILEGNENNNYRMDKWILLQIRERFVIC